ncbi:MAG TPA: DUF3293 domain-containing protein [Burkholderiales bacterium]|nr:DUF3293 domain-containing protein [Burkholderiales bacterium]
MRVDRRSPELLDLYQRLGVSSAGCITACNPFSRKLREAQNRRRMRALEQSVARLRWPALPTRGQDPRCHWPDEPGLLVLGASADDVCRLGRHFGQNAVLIAQWDGIPHLVFLRSRCGPETSRTLRS